MCRLQQLEMRIKNLKLVIIGVIGLFAITLYIPQLSYPQEQQHSSLLPSKLVLSTRGYFDPSTGDITQSGIHNSAALANFNLNANNCPDNLAIYVHGIWAREQEATEQYNRIADSYKKALKAIDSTIQPMPVILYTWDSNTLRDIPGSGWRIGQDIADDNGKFLAESLLNISNSCNSQVGINVISHSMGARVVLAALHNLGNTSLEIKSVHLLGAAVDGEEVSKNRNDNQDSLNDDGIVYGNDIQNRVKKFYVLFNPLDDLLRFGRLPYTYYPTYEGDLALGNLGVDPQVASRDIPANYKEINVQNDLPKDVSINFTDADGDGQCDLDEPIGFFFFLVCGIHGQGENHRGYMGFRDHTSHRIVDDGAMDIVARDWVMN